MIVNEERKTTGKQRLIILAIAAFMLFSTFALYVSIVLNYQNSETQAQLDQDKQNKLSQLYSEYQLKLNDQANELSKKYFDTFKPYLANVKAFNAASVTELKTNDLVKGSGRKVQNQYDEDGNLSNADVDYAAYYIGYLADETIFDSSFSDPKNPTTLKNPLDGSDRMIQGWLEGIDGMHIGGIREITIPSVLAYGDQEQNGIPANSPLKFIVMLIEKPEKPEVPDELENLYQELYGASFREQMQ